MTPDREVTLGKLRELTERRDAARAIVRGAMDDINACDRRIAKCIDDLIAADRDSLEAAALLVMRTTPYNATPM